MSQQIAQITFDNGHEYVHKELRGIEGKTETEIKDLARSLAIRRYGRNARSWQFIKVEMLEVDDDYDNMGDLLN